MVYSLYFVPVCHVVVRLLSFRQAQFSQTPSSELTAGEMTSSMHQREVRPRAHAMGIFQGQGYSTSNHATKDHFIRKPLSLSSCYHLDVI